MGMEYLKTIHGMITVVQALIGLAALLTCGLYWEQGNVVWLFWLSGHGGQIIVLFFLFLTWVVALGILTMQLTGKDVLEQMGKIKVLILHGICAALMLVCAALDTHYTISTTSGLHYHPRFIFVMIFSFILLISYLVQMVFVFFQ